MEKATPLIIESGITIEDVLLYSCSLVNVVSTLIKCSKSHARRLIKGGGVSVRPRNGNLRRVMDDTTLLCGFFTIKVGKYKWFYKWLKGHYRDCYE